MNKITSILSAIAVFALASLSVSGIAAAADKPELNIYTYDAFAAEWGPAPQLKEKFEKTCNCTVNFIAADSSIGALRKVQLEGKNTKADIVLGLDTNIMEAARATNLFMPHGVAAPSLAIPGYEKWEDTLFLPFDYSYFAFVYNSEKTKNAPTSFEALLAMDDDFKIVIQDPRSSTPGLGLLLWVKELYGDKAPEVWSKLKPKIVTVTKGWSDAYGLFLKGEADMALSYTTSPAYHLIAEEDAKFASADFAEGHYMQIEVAGIVKGTKNEALAKSFMQFMLSDEFQDTIPTTNWTYPVTNTQAGLPKGFETLSIPQKSLLMDGNKVEQNRKAWIAEFVSALAK